MKRSLAAERTTLALCICLAVCLASTASAQVEDRSGGGVTLHREANYQGISETFYSDVADLRGSRIGNDQATSVSLGGDCQARLYANTNYTGAYLQMAFGVADLRGSRVGNDTASSLKVRCGGTHWGEGSSGSSSGGGWGGGSSGHGVTLYRDLNFSGTSQTFTDDISDLRGSMVGNDSATSIRISQGCQARLYADAGYRGAHVEVDRDISDLRGSPVGNDSVTSIQVRCDGSGFGGSGGEGWGGSGGGDWGGGSSSYGVTLYRDLNFSGTSQTFTDDASDLRGSLVGNDTATSVRLSRGCRARLYANAGYQGAYVEIDRDISDLRGSRVGNDSATSIQVRCDGSGFGGSGGEGWGGSDQVTLYEHTGFRGAAYSFDSDVSDLRSSYGANDEASSVRVAPSCTVRLYQDPQFRGAYTETSRDISDLTSSRVGNDSVSSLQVRCR